MHGNVLEWVEDCWNEGYSGAPAEGSAWLAGNCTLRVVRGGSWFNGPWVMRAAYRVRGEAGVRDYILGFRVSRTL
jgi:formylglycine-generating enzyme required for sulfatase activity